MKPNNFLFSLFILFLLPFLTFTSFLSTVDLSYYISSKTAIQITGETVGSELGYTVSNGDINGDGYDDMVIGAPLKNSNQGEVYVIYGGPNADFVNINLASIALSPATDGFTITGNAVGDLFGMAIGVCDIDNDGFDDIIAGAPSKNSSQGIVYVIYDTTTTLYPATTGFTITGNNQTDFFGGAISNGGDINGDGYDDIVIGASAKNLYKGAAYVIYGGPRSNLTNIDLSIENLDPQTNGFFISGNGQGNNFGCSVRSAGDLNKDGYDDILIGAKNYNNVQGAAYLIYGKPKASFSDIDLSTESLKHSTTGFMILGNTQGDLFGFSVHIGGDMNADEYEDMIIGAPYKNSYQGAAYVIYGGPTSGFSDVMDLSQTPLDPITTGFTLTGNSAGDRFGYSVDSSSGNQTHSWVIGAPYHQTNLGIIYVIYGQAKANATNVDLSSISLDPAKTGFAVTGAVVGSSFGSSITVGDFNKDDLPEILVGSPWFESNTGAAYLLFPLGMCSYNCSSCTLPATCEVCLVGYGLANDVCELCTGATYSDSGYSCVDCMSNCEQCTDEASCDTCESGFFYANSQCNACPSGTFLEALSGAYLCLSCSQGCAECTSSTSCQECSSGYFAESSSTTLRVTCLSCSTISSLCSECSDASTCTACYSGYFIYSSICLPSCPSQTYGNAGICEDCPSNCMECTDGSTCTLCNSGYLLYISSCFQSCPTSTYPDESTETCENCSSNCIECTDGLTCEACGDGYGLYMGQCVDQCPDSTYLASNGSCTSCQDDCSQCTDSVTCTLCNDGYGLMLEECVPCLVNGVYLAENGSCESCIEGCSKCSDSFTCEKCETGLTLINSQCALCPVGTYLSGQSCKTCPTGCSECTSKSTCQACIDGYSLSDSSHLCAVDGNTREQAASDTFDGTSIAGAALASGSSLPINFGLVAKILRNTKYLDITVSSELEETFYSWKVASGFLAAPESWSLKVNSKALPEVFSRYSLAPLFLINYWKPLVMTLIGFVLFVAFKGVEVMRLNKNSTILRSIHLQASNFALTQIYSNLDDVILYLILDARSTKFDESFGIFSIILAVIMLIIGGLVLLAHLFLLSQYQAVKSEKSQTERFLFKFENLKLIFKDFKDINLLTQSFLWAHIVRALLASVLFAALYEYPLVQVVLLLFLNIGIVAFLLVKKPFKDPFGTFSQLFCEIVLLIANICMLIMAVFDQTGSYPVAAMEHLGRAVIILNDILLLGGAILMIIEVLRSLYMSYKEKKKTPVNDTAVKRLPSMQKARLNPDHINSTFDLNQSEGQGDNLELRNYGFNPQQNYFQEGYHNGGQNLTTTEKNQMEIHDLSLNGFDNHSQLTRSGYVGENFDHQQQGGFSQNIDETMMNISNTNLLNYNSPMRAEPSSYSKPRIRGKIKMPGGVVIVPKRVESQGSTVPLQNLERPHPANMTPGISFVRSPPQMVMRSPELNYQQRNGMMMGKAQVRYNQK